METNFLLGIVIALLSVLIGVAATLSFMKHFSCCSITKRQHGEKKRNDEIQRSLRGQVFSYNQRRKKLYKEPEELKGYTYSYFKEEELPEHCSLPVYVYQVDDKNAHAILRVKQGIYEITDGPSSHVCGALFSNVRLSDDDWEIASNNDNDPQLELYCEDGVIKTKYLHNDDGDFTW